MSLLKKLQIKDPHGFFVIKCPEKLSKLLFQEGLTLQISPENYQSGGVLLFVRNVKELNAMIGNFVKDELADSHWVAFPKKASKIPTDLGRDHGWDKLTATDWLPVRQVSLNDQWSALRFRPRANIKEIKRGTDYPGIDSKNKTVIIPKILDENLHKTGLIQTFESLSFTRRKEFVISILSAKKSETLERRINKILKELS